MRGEAVRCSYALAVLVGLLAVSVPVDAGEYRSFDGTGNNPDNPTYGVAGENLIRITNLTDYDDGASSPRTTDVGGALPSARLVSNTVAAQGANDIPNAKGATDWLWQWGQFIDHDIDHTPTQHAGETFDVPVPTGDPFFDPNSTGTQVIGMRRSIHDAGSPRQQPNVITAFIDGSAVYGSDPNSASKLRSHVDGLMKTTLANNGEVLLPKNDASIGFDMANENLFLGQSDLFAAGDVRANEQLGLTATHTLMVREHNRIAADLLARINANETALVAKRDAAIADGTNDVNDQDDFLYYSARKLAAAQVQKITYEEFLPMLLGSSAPDPTAYSYSSSVDASSANEFAHAAYRVGHTMLSPNIARFGDTDLPLRDAFFTPNTAVTDGIDSILKGFATHMSQEIDNLIVDDVRNFLFGPPGAGGFDLASLNTQRGRDHGLPSLNAARVALGLGSHNNFLDLTGGDATLAAALASVYADVDAVDLWVGGLAEAHAGDSMVGETFGWIIADQFTRLMNGDRFFYTDTDLMAHLLALDPNFDATTLSALIMRNSSMTGMQANAFAIPEPASIVLLAIGGLTVVRRRRA